MCEEAFQIAEKRREAKGKGEKERYTQLNVGFQRIARRGKTAFLSEQCKTTTTTKKKKKKESNGLGKTKISSRKLELSSEHFMQRWAQ